MNILEEENKDRSLSDLFDLSDEYIDSILIKINIKVLNLSIRANNIFSNYYIYTIADLVLLSPQDLLDMNNSGVLTVNQIFEECKKLVLLLQQDKKYTAKVIESYISTDLANMDLFNDNKVSKELLVLLPLFSDNNDFAEVSNLHSSYRGDESIKSLFLCVRAMTVLISSKIITIKQLLLTRQSKLLNQKNCGRTTITEITNKVISLYFENSPINKINELMNSCDLNNTKNKDVFLDYLCDNNGCYKTYNEIAIKYEISRQRVQQISDKLTKKIKIFIEKNDNIFIFYIIENALKIYKGPILISELRNQKIVDDKTDVELKRIVRLYYLLYKSIDIDKKKYLFWNKVDKYVECRDLDNNSKISDNNIYGGLNDGQDNDLVVEKKLLKEYDISQFNKFLENNSIIISNIQNNFVEYFLNKSGKISSLVLKSFCRIRGIEINELIVGINNLFYKKVNENFLVYIEHDDSWEINPELDLCNKDVGKSVVENSCEYKIKAIIDNKGGDNRLIAKSKALNIYKSIDNHNIFLSNTCKQTQKSYKFYWALSLYFFIYQNKKEIAFNQMVAAMCSFAWEDVLISKVLPYSDDYVNELVKTIYNRTYIQIDETFENIYRQIIDFITPVHTERLLRYVPKHFLGSFVEAPIYNINDNSIIINYDFFEFDLHDAHNYKLIIDNIFNLKNEYLNKKKREITRYV